MTITEATKQEIRATIADGETTGRWSQPFGNGEGRAREFETSDGTEIGAVRDPEDGTILIFALATGEEITAQI
jgi:hypothetical protein